MFESSLEPSRKQSLIYKVIGVIVLTIITQWVYADTDEQLAKIAQNPVANVITLPFQNNTNFNYGFYNRTQNILNIQPVIPFELSSHLNLITRTILPIMHQPELLLPTGATNGMGDTNPTFLLTPITSKTLIWGLGPTFLLPTATDKNLGTGKWAAGPAGVIVLNTKNWVVGAIANNLWSFTGQRERMPVNLLTVQYFINYNLPKGWYLTSSPIINANWVLPNAQRWTLPFGGGIGRAFKIGKQPVNINSQYFYNVLSPEVIGPQSTIRVVVQFLFTENA